MEILFFIIDSSPPISEIKSNPSNIISLILIHESTHLTTINNLERYINNKEKSLLKIKNNLSFNKNFTEKSKIIIKYSLVEESTVILGKGEFIINQNNNNSNYSLNNTNNKIITINLNNNNNSKLKSNFLRLNIKTKINKMLCNNIHSPKINKKKNTNFTANISTTNSTTSITKNNTQTQQIKNLNVLNLKNTNNSKKLISNKTKNKILSHNLSVENGLNINKNINTENFLSHRNSNVSEKKKNYNKNYYEKKFLFSEKKKNNLNFNSIKNKILIRNLKIKENNYTTVDNSKIFNTNYNIKNKRLNRSLTKKKLEERIIDINYKNKLKNDEFILNKNLSEKNIFNIDEKLFFDKKILIESDSSLDNNNILNNNNLNDENYENFFENKKNSFFIFYTNEYIKSINKDTLLLELSLSLEKIFDLQEVYHKNFNKYYKQFKINKNNFYLYSELYLTMNKINEKLNYRKKKNLRNNYKNNLIKKSIKNINNEIIPCFNNKEINIWKNLINKCSIPENNNISPLKIKFIKIFFYICEKNLNKLNSLSMKYYKFIYEKYYFYKN